MRLEGIGEFIVRAILTNSNCASILSDGDEIIVDTHFGFISLS
jgi:hypothetical protein